jgi:peptide/nickel transport system substrate-binding protein
MPGYDKDLAQQLFDKATTELGGPVQFTLYATPANTANAEFVQPLVNQYKNVKMDIQTLTGAQVVPLVSTGDYQASTNQIVMYEPDPALYNNVQSASTQNFVKFSDPQVDDALAKARSASDHATVESQYETVQRVLYEQVPFILFTRPKLSYLLQDHVQGFVNTNTMLLSDRLWLS